MTDLRGGDVSLSTDRSSRLFCFGIALVMIGTVLFVPVMGLILDWLLHLLGDSNIRSISITTIVPPLLLFGGLGVAMIWVGIGSILRQRWARPVVLSFASIALAGGLTMLAVRGVFSAVSYYLPDSIEIGGFPPRTAAAKTALANSQIEETFQFVLTSLLSTVGPALFLWGYAGQSVGRTLDRANPSRGWTDRRPLPATALALLLAYLGYLSLIIGTLGTAPFFGSLLHGATAFMAQCGWMTAWLVAAGLVVANLRAGPWVSMLLIALQATSFILTMATTTLKVDLPSMPWIYAVQTLEIQMRLVKVMIVVGMYALPAVIFALFVRRRAYQFRQLGESKQTTLTVPS